MQDMTVSPSPVDFSEAHAVLQRHVDADLLAGVSAAIIKGRDLVDVHCVGWANKEARIPLRVDHIFRVFSNTKLATSCAVLLLHEQGLLRLDDPIERFIPQLADRQVLKPGATDLADTEPAASPITIRQLMSHSAGLSYGLFDPGTTIFNAYNKLRILHANTTLDDMIGALSQLPLTYHPGTSFEYSVATDVLSRLVEVISGQRFDEFLRARIFAPLGMEDTDFVVPVDKQARFARFYAGADLVDQMKPGLTPIDDDPYPQAYLRPVARLSGGGGLVSTLPDMVRLIRSLLPNGPTLLKPETIGLMMTNQLADGVWQKFPAIGELRGRGFGLAGGIVVSPSVFDHPNAEGELYWGGVAGTQWWISPRHDMAGLLMTQRRMAFAHPFALEFKNRVYEALSRAGG
ncbi:MAG: serine hydrolase domain-containing protein [Burkholderiaceae bacterium]